MRLFTCTKVCPLIAFIHLFAEEVAESHLMAMPVDNLLNVAPVYDHEQKEVAKQA